jgi:hypothetical protein
LHLDGKTSCATCTRRRWRRCAPSSQFLASPVHDQYSQKPAVVIVSRMQKYLDFRLQLGRIGWICPPTLPRIELMSQTLPPHRSNMFVWIHHLAVGSSSSPTACSYRRSRETTSSDPKCGGSWCSPWTPSWTFHDEKNECASTNKSRHSFHSEQHVPALVFSP